MLPRHSSSSLSLRLKKMRKNTHETFELNCPYKENHAKCEVKECEECAVLTAFCRINPAEHAHRSKTSGEIVAVSANLEEIQVAQTE